jgi:hypothetical protein
MNALSKIAILLLLVATGFGIVVLTERFLITPDGPVLKSELERKHRDGIPEQESDRSATLAEITFDLLDEARPLDLIEMDLAFPEQLLALEGRRVRIVGFMAPYDSLESMRRCMVVPSYVGCSFCSPPSLTQVVYVEQVERKGENHPFIESPALFSGTLRLTGQGEPHEGHGQGFVFVLDKAVVTPWTAPEAPVRAPGHGEGAALDPTAHQKATGGGANLASVTAEALVARVAALRELSPRVPLRFEPVSRGRFAELLREEAEARFGNGTEILGNLATAFRLLGFSEEEIDWPGTVLGLALGQRIALADAGGESIRHLAEAPLDDPYVRLEFVKEIAEALARQHFETARSLGEGASDAARALEAIRQGNKQLVAYRYARAENISPASQPPTDLRPDLRRYPSAPPDFDLWYWLPWEAGPFFVDSRTGATGSLARIDALFLRPPTTTIEIFRPSWYEDASLWRHDAVPIGFADELLARPPALTGVLGLGGIVPMLAAEHPVDVAKQVAGGWAGDRYALWAHPDGESALLLETRWRDEAAAQRFFQTLPTQPIWRVEKDPANEKNVLLFAADREAARDALLGARQVSR